eukprot:6400752-Prymnesium_polylepis.1
MNPSLLQTRNQIPEIPPQQSAPKTPNKTSEKREELTKLVATDSIVKRTYGGGFRAARVALSRRSPTRCPHAHDAAGSHTQTIIYALFTLPSGRLGFGSLLGLGGLLSIVGRPLVRSGGVPLDGSVRLAVAGVRVLPPASVPPSHPLNG